MSAKKRVARFRGRSSISRHPIEAIHRQGEALEELGFGIERLIYKFRRIPDDAGPTLEALCEAANGVEVEFHLPHDRSLGTIGEFAEYYRGAAVSIVSCCLTTDCFEEEDSRGLYVFSKLEKLTMCVNGRTTYGEDLDSMWLALSNCGNLKELVLDLSGSQFDEEDAEFLKERIPDNLSDSFCNFSVKYVWRRPRFKKKFRRR
jgi:hypothetical protein